jgi:hypothetical protein
MRHATRLAFAFIGFVPAARLIAQPPGPPPDGTVTAADRSAVIDSAVSRLRRGYVDPAGAERMAAAVRRRQRAGAYDTVTSGRGFAAALTAELRAASRDQHLEVEYTARSAPGPVGSGPEPAAREAQRAFARAVNHGVDRVERMAGNVGVLALRTFAAPAEAAEKVAGAMALLADTDALIVDLRYNPGGHPAAVQFLASYLFDGAPVLLNALVWRSAAGNAPASVTDTARGPGLTQQSWTLPYVPGRRYAARPVYVLTSRHTASGAEEFAYALQARRRATVVGDTTAGAANPGGTERLTPHFALFVPRGRAVNPVTGTSWERVGVAPDVVVAADHALAHAYLLALQEVRRRGDYAGPEPLDVLVAEAQRALAATGGGR